VGTQAELGVGAVADGVDAPRLLGHVVPVDLGSCRGSGRFAVATPAAT
jgi:hypothetical protein